ncbi:murein hydrolase activator EnvC family protein [Spongiivirga citrea]|uniref:Peptidoglycan DD-metalloendopeptidase family protein n=1 Tax=Spongiivirga citrea TaxID=1481457 RepID=A0A6M0CSD9_9FLAO|nr:peptidoglycan DD-metalloendopeptidase family protein [Spongiivirga citrea]NER19004.1 peptidoglycan DD-metalloendopeptidase family protein [Spongiivirga citrea]
MKKTFFFSLYPILFFIALLCWPSLSTAQSAKQKELQQRQEKLQQEIKQINKLFFEVKRESKSVLERLEDMDQKVNALQRLIRVSNQQANLYTREIDENLKSIAKLRSDLSSLKNEYADMIKRSYKSKSEQSRIMFLLSSEDFLQAYKRMQYMKQFTRHRRKQGEQISAKTEELQLLNIDLKEKKKEKEAVLAENKKTQKQLKDDQKQQQDLIAVLKKDQNRYVSEIRSKQRESDRIDSQLKALIAEAIAASNKKAGKTGSKTFALTPADKIIAGNFVANKGRLPWPIEKGVVTRSYGVQQHPIFKGNTIRSNGLRIASEKGAKARSIFDGEVLQVQVQKRGNPKVLIRHGNYISVYGNLQKVFVKKGDKIKAKQEIGEVFTSRSSGKTELYFSVFKESSTMNPSPWLASK